MPDRLPARIIYEGFYCNRRYAAMTSLSVGGLAAQSVNILMGIGALLPGDCPHLSSTGTGISAEDGAVPGLRAPVSPGVSAGSSRLS